MDTYRESSLLDPAVSIEQDKETNGNAIRRLGHAGRDPDEPHKRFRLLAVGLYLVSGFVYLAWRTTTFYAGAPVFSAVLYLAELYGFLMSFLIIMLSWRIERRTPPAAPLGLKVDVFITTYNESLAVVRRTVLAAMRIRYPHETFLLDDGNRFEMRAMARELGCRYYARTENIGAKAGNLNHGLEHSQADFVAMLDADHVPQHDFLDQLLGYFNDPHVAFVQTPQDYFNTDSFQHGRAKHRRLIWHEQSFFHYVGQPGRNYWNAVTLCGCSAVLRRSALDRIGGFPAETVTEDMHAAVRLQKLGYKTVYHAEPLAFGVAPADFRGYVRQRLRWGEGNMQVCREEGLPFCKDLTLAQRLCYFALTSTYLDGWQKLVYYLAPAIVLFTQVPPIWADPVVFAAYFAPYLFCTWLYFEEVGRGYGRIFSTEKYAMARLAAALVATLGLFRKRIQFRVSSKSLVGELPLILLLPQIVVFVASTTAISFTLLRPILDWPLDMPVGITIFIGVWAATNATLSGIVIYDAVRSSRLKAGDYRFAVPLPVRICVGGVWRYGVVGDISENGFTVPARMLAGFVDARSAFDGELYLPDGRLGFKAQPVEHRESRGPHRATVDCLFLWVRTADHDRLDLSLYAGRWHRAVLRQHERVRTPWEWLSSMISRRATCAPSPTWQPVLYRPSRDDDGYRLAYLSAAGGHNQNHRMLVFEHVHAGEEFRLRRLDDGNAHDLSARILIGGADTGVRMGVDVMETCVVACGA